jgi:5-methylcytosine-specific restriction endonuclease McrA
VHEWRIRTDAGYVRTAVETRDHGICGICGADCARIARIAKILLYAPDDQNPHPTWCRGSYHSYMCQHPSHKEVAAFLRELGFDQHRKSLWDADHVLEVVNGGGECGLENYMTLCQPCHKAKTKKLAQDRAKARREAKKTGQPHGNDTSKQ